MNGYGFESLQYGDFSILHDGGRRPPPPCIFIYSLIFIGGNGQEYRTTSFYRNRSNRGRDIAIFGFFKMAAAVILDFKIFNGRTRQEGQTSSLSQISTKSLQSRPTCGDFLLFKMAAAAIFGF